MASILTFPINNVEVPIKCHPNSPDLDLPRCIASKLFLDWVNNLDPALKITEVLVSSVDNFGSRIGFLKIEVAAFFNGVRVPGICFLRGGAVSILVVLKSEGKDWVLLTKQPRVPVGASDLLELPAGMLDGSGAFAGVAAKEMEEETGIILGEGDLVDLTKLAQKGGKPTRGMYPSAGGCDEFLRLMYHERMVTRSELDAMRGKQTGLRKEGEVITLELVPYADLWQVCSDAKALSSMLLFERLRAAGEV